MGHQVFNYGMYTPEDECQLTYVQVGILAAVLLNSGAADYVITGCGTGEGAFQGIVLLSERPCPPLLLSYPLMEISMKRKKWCKSNNIDEYIEKVLYKTITIFGDFINIYCVINNKPKKQNNKCIENCRESVLY